MAAATCTFHVVLPAAPYRQNLGFRGAIKRPARLSAFAARRAPPGQRRGDTSAIVATDTRGQRGRQSASTKAKSLVDELLTVLERDGEGVDLNADAFRKFKEHHGLLSDTEGVRAREAAASPRVYVQGDPILISPSQGEYHYLGAAVFVCFDLCGTVQSIDFVDTCIFSEFSDSDDGDYISEVWSWSAANGTWRYVDLRASARHPDDRRIMCNDPAWRSELLAGSEPPHDWFARFEATQQTFCIIPDAQGGRYTYGPPYALLKAAITQPATLSQSLTLSPAFDVVDWQRRALRHLAAQGRRLKHPGLASHTMCVGLRAAMCA